MEGGPGTRGQAKKRRKSDRLLLPGKRKLGSTFGRGLSGYQKLLKSHVGRRRFGGDKGQLEVVDDLVHNRIVGEESDDLHRAAASRAKERVDFVDLPDHGRPAFSRDGPELLLHHPESKSLTARLLVQLTVLLAARIFVARCAFHRARLVVVSWSDRSK